MSDKKTPQNKKISGNMNVVAIGSMPDVDVFKFETTRHDDACETHCTEKQAIIKNPDENSATKAILITIHGKENDLNNHMFTIYALGDVYDISDNFNEKNILQADEFRLGKITQHIFALHHRHRNMSLLLAERKDIREGLKEGMEHLGMNTGNDISAMRLLNLRELNDNYRLFKSLPIPSGRWKPDKIVDISLDQAISIETATFLDDLMDNRALSDSSAINKAIVKEIETFLLENYKDATLDFSIKRSDQSLGKLPGFSEHSL